ncbi:beta-1 adrenergic receptor-like [Patiria miniata]|uniref:G-protein coupled receptors family 1 profile domain-containing protein n=1 Tax=Patiria miniata TaxID=46514 RepID=A0A913ZS28_PATMI|nr:beta-1 adrenergic receptor-like [Patiria miniata]
MNIHMNSTGSSEDLSTFNASTTPTTQDRIEYNFIRCILLIITTTLLLTLNPLCLVVLRHVRSIQETTKIFLRSMTIADLGMGLFQALPMTVLAISETEHIGEAFCQVLSFAGEIVIYSPQMSLLLLTVDRYISVVYALRYPSLVTVKKMNIHMNSTGSSEDLSTFNASTTPTTQDRIEYNFIRCILLVITTILLLTLNPLCLVVLRHVRSIQETTKIFLRSMTIADLGVGLFRALPMTVLVISETEHIGEVFCQVLSFASEILIYGPQMSLLLLTVDRYISVVYALRYPSLIWDSLSLSMNTTGQSGDPISQSLAQY